jgi:phage/plasmid-associated DNA primase
MIDENPEAPYNIFEQATRDVAIIVNCEFSFPQSDDQPFDENILNMHMVRTIQQTAIELFSLSESDEDVMKLSTIVFSSAKYASTAGHDVYQFRYHMPFLVSDNMFLQQTFRQTLIANMRREMVLECFSSQPISDWSQCLLMLTDLIPMYLTTTDGKPKLVFDEVIYGVLTIDNLNGQTQPDILAVDDVFTTNSHGHIVRGFINPALFSDTHPETWLPFILSAHYCVRTTVPHREQNRVTSEDAPVRFNLINPGPPSSQSDKIVAEKLLRYVDIKRANDEEDVVRIGRALYSCYSASEIGLKMWIDFCRKGKLYDEVRCREKWYGLKSGNYTVKEIADMAQTDSPKAYEQWHSQWCIESLRHSVSGLHDDISIAIYRCYWLDFVCASIEKNLWYEYVNHHWLKLDAASGLTMRLKKDFVRRLERMRLTILEMQNQSNDERERKMAEDVARQISTLIARVKNYGFKNTLIKSSMTEFHDPTFLKNADNNTDLLGVSNGVIYATSTAIKFRAGRRQDYLTIQAPVEFHGDMTIDHPLVRKMLRWIDQVFPNPNIRHMWWMAQSSILRAGNIHKKLMVNWGPVGGNAKSSIAKLKEKTLGDYCVKIPLEAISKGGRGGGPSPEIAQARSARIITFDEPDEDSELRKSWIKLLTGRDSLFARFCNENGGKFEIIAKIDLNCNTIPFIMNPDKATMTRWCIMPHLSEWVENLNVEHMQAPDGHDVYRADPNFDDCLNELAVAYLWLMVYYYPQYIKEGLVIPEEIKQINKSYWANNDIYSAFIREKLERVYLPGGTHPDTSQTVLKQKIYAAFSSWFSLAFPGLQITKSLVFYEEMSQVHRMGPLTGESWAGFRFKQRNGIDGYMTPQGGAAQPADNRVRT